MSNQNLMENDEKDSIDSSVRKMKFVEAIALTINQDPQSPPLNKCQKCCVKCTGRMGPFQLCLFIAFVLLANMPDVIVFGQGFLTKDPNKFECVDEATQEWKACSKEEVCDQHLA